MSKVSIIMPIYNVEKYLSKAIESVLNQTYTDFELILINDRSTDNSKEICNEYLKKDSRIVFFENNTENHGPGPTRNIGLDNATGEFVYFMDSDDWIDNSLFQCAVERIRETNADIVQVGVEYEWNDGKNSLQQYWNGKPLMTKDEIKNDFENFRYKNGFMLWQQFFKMKTVKSIRFENIMNGEDLSYVMDAYCNAERIAYISKPLYHYRHIVGSTSHRWVENIIFCLEQQWEHQKKYLQSFDEGIDISAYALLAYDNYMWAISQLSSDFCPISYKDKKRELKLLKEKIGFNKYRGIYSLKFHHGIDKIYYALVKYRFEGIILILRPIYIKKFKRT